MKNNKFTRASWRLPLVLSLGLISTPALAVGGKLIATGGVNTIDGAGGGGIVPMALLSGYGTRDEIGGAAFRSEVDVQDYHLNATGAAVTFYDRVELSAAHQEFHLGGRVLPGNTIRQDIFGVKVKLAGDAIFNPDSPMPQVSAGLLYKVNKDFNFIPKAVGGRHADGTDFYIAASKLYFDAIAGRNVLLNGVLRATNANQDGLLGFGGDRNDSYRLQPEVSAAIFLRDNLLFGGEYKSNPNNLSAAPQDRWGDVFVAWLPVKGVALTAAYVDLGHVAGYKQKGTYLSAELSF